MSNNAAEQAQLGTIAASLETLVTTIDSATTTIEAEIATLQAANPALDFSGVNKALSDITQAVSQVAAIPPAPVDPQAFDPSSLLPLYSYAGTDPVDASEWTLVTDVTGPGGQPLYTNVNDTANVDATEGSDTWPPFIGAVSRAN